MAYRFEELNVSEDILLFIEQIYSITARYPAEEKFGLTSQTRRAANSVYLNLAEGSARRSSKDYAKFVGISLGSVMEVHAALTIAKKLNFIDTATLEPAEALGTSIWKQLCGLRNALLR
jgi:four helix bundle protein